MQQAQRTASTRQYRSVIPSSSTRHIRSRRPWRCSAYSTFTTPNDSYSISSSMKVLSGAALASAPVLLSSPGLASAAAPAVTGTGVQELSIQQQQQQQQPLEQQPGNLHRDPRQQQGLVETEAVQTSQANQLCATPFGIDIVGVTISIALIGAAVGGYTSRRRKEEAERLNEQLRKINASLRQQARAGSISSPGLQYTPSSSSSSSSSSNAKTATITLPKPASTTPSLTAAPAASSAAVAPVAVRTLLSMDENEMTAEQLECKETLRAGKRMLKEKQAAGAQLHFEQALVLSRMIGDRLQERRAVRGLAAAARLQQQYQTAIGHLERVLELSTELKEYTGDADAYGTIVDCYTELGNFEKAAEFYDKYITRMDY